MHSSRPIGTATPASFELASQAPVLSRSFLFVPHSSRQRYIAEACAEALGGANSLLDRSAYCWAIRSAEETGEAAAGRILVLIGAVDAPWHPSTVARLKLSVAMHRARHICLIGGAVFLHALAGGGTGLRVAVSPALRSGFAEAWPETELTPATVSRNGRISSAIGCAAALRLTVGLVSEADGTAMGRALTQRLGLEETIAAETQSLLVVTAAGDPLISRAVILMNTNLESRLSTAEVARRLDMSRRNLERQFRSHLGMTPLQAYRELRLARARDLLTQTNMPIEQIALASGFARSSSLSKWLRHRFGETPTVMRRRAFRGALA